MVFGPPPALKVKGTLLLKGVKNTALKVESSLRRIESAVRQAKRRFTAAVPTWVTLLDVPRAGVSKGSLPRKPEESTAPCNCVAIVAAEALPHQSWLACKLRPPKARALVPLFLITELTSVNWPEPSCSAPMPLNSSC